MTYLLDTNCCVIYLRGTGSSKLAALMGTTSPGTIVLCSVVVGELLYGAYRSMHVDRTLHQVREFCEQFTSLPFDDAAAEEYGRLRADLTKRGMIIGPNDLMIASIALANDVKLVTHNTAEFSRVPGLTLEDWQIA